MLKRINRDEAVDAIYQGKQVYLMMNASAFTTLNALYTAAGYLIEVEDDERFPAEPEQWTEADDEEDEEPDETEDEPDENEDEPAENEDINKRGTNVPQPRQVPHAPERQGQKDRHQSIINMYMAGRSIRYIAQEFEINPATVKYHLHKEGLV